MLDAYRSHVAERLAEGLPPLPLNAEQTGQLVELLKTPPIGEETFLLDLLTHRVPPGVDDASYIKAAFLADVAKECSHEMITISGYTDSDGSESYNKRLSTNRASAVRYYLISLLL